MLIWLVDLRHFLCWWGLGSGYSLAAAACWEMQCRLWAAASALRETFVHLRILCIFFSINVIFSDDRKLLSGMSENSLDWTDPLSPTADCVCVYISDSVTRRSLNLYIKMYVHIFWLYFCWFIDVTMWTHCRRSYFCRKASRRKTQCTSWCLRIWLVKDWTDVWTTWAAECSPYLFIFYRPLWD